VLFSSEVDAGEESKMPHRQKPTQEPSSNRNDGSITYRTETTISRSGTLTLRGIPFHAGEKVEVIVAGVPGVPQSIQERDERYPLRGRPVRYTGPFESVAEGDWEVLR
jgi:hypothetical protein